MDALVCVRVFSQLIEIAMNLTHVYFSSHAPVQDFTQGEVWNLLFTQISTYINVVRKAHHKSARKSIKLW